MQTLKRKISIVAPCFNEEGNVEALSIAIKNIFETIPDYEYELLFIDNSSTDNTVEILRKIAKIDKHIKVIVNIRNFGHVRSPFYALFQAQGDAIILMACDFQDPPSLIPELIKKWEENYKIVTAVKKKSKENPLMFFVRKLYYNLLAKFSEGEQVKNFTGFGLYDRSFIEVIKKIDDPYPYFRGLISELGFQRTELVYDQPKRLHGKSKNNFYTLYDLGMLGFVNHSKLPLRLASFIGFGVAIINILIAIGYLVYKLIYWYSFEVGVAPLVIGIFFFGGVQLFFLGIIGEYIGAIFTQVKKRPLVFEKERINFDD
jgi:polyisoprenyl-phosphate glycosyltransferase